MKLFDTRQFTSNFNTIGQQKGNKSKHVVNFNFKFIEAYKLK